MRNRHTWHATVLMLAIVAAPQPVSAGDAARLHISVHVVADARVPRDVVERAKPETARIYQHIGIDVVFVDESSADIITVRVVETPMKEAKGAAMGVAPRGGSQIGCLAYAFYGRVDSYARQHATSVAEGPGHVMAHELGHLLLPHGSHAKRGIMTAAWDRKQIEQIGRGWLSFTKAQAEAIRAHVSGRIPTNTLFCGKVPVEKRAAEATSNQTSVDRSSGIFEHSVRLGEHVETSVIPRTVGWRWLPRDPRTGLYAHAIFDVDPIGGPRATIGV